jgi:anhydro-N-acetylmuramic acid kinase
MRLLAQTASGRTFTGSSQHGIDPDWIEAVAFAWLAQRTVYGEPGNLPSVTGARHAVILGGIYPALRRDTGKPEA